MERDVRATERPVTQRFCTINTSCSRGGGGSSQSSHTRARARAHAAQHRVRKRRAPWRAAQTLALGLGCRQGTASKAPGL